MGKKNSDDIHTQKWNGPPFSRVIKVSELKIKKTNKLKIILNKKEVLSLIKFLEVQSIDTFNCIINLDLFKGKLEINGYVSIVCIFQCVISLEDLKYKLRIPIKRLLTPNQNLKKNNISFCDDTNSDTDPLTEEIDLGDIISEELYLSIPKYPKKKGVKLSNILPNEEDIKLNPFKKLEKLKF